MVEIKKSWEEYTQTYDIDIIKKDKILRIVFSGALDLHWIFINKGYFSDKDMTFEITKENYYIYSLFENLFSDIKECRVHHEDEYRLEMCETYEEIQELLLENDRRNMSFRRRDSYIKLFHNGMIEWHCDDNPYDESNIVCIRKSRDSFKLDFKFISKELGKQGGVRFRNSGSRYDPFNRVFMRMYHALQEYDPNYHQIYIEEYLYNIKK